MLSDTRNAHTNPDQPWHWRKRPEEVHTFLKKRHSKMILIALEHVEWLSKGEVAHHVKAEVIKQL